MRCDNCKWWDAFTLNEMKAMNMTDELREKGGGLCRMEPSSVVTAADDRCRHFDPKETKPKTPAELREIAEDITRKMGGEVPETPPPRGCRVCFNWVQYGHRDDQGSCCVKNGQTTHFRHTCDEFAGKEIPEPVPTNSADPKWVANEIGELWKAIGELAEKV